MARMTSRNVGSVDGRGDSERNRRMLTRTPCAVRPSGSGSWTKTINGLLGIVRVRDVVACAAKSGGINFPCSQASGAGCSACLARRRQVTVSDVATPRSDRRLKLTALVVALTGCIGEKPVVHSDDRPAADEGGEDRTEARREPEDPHVLPEAGGAVERSDQCRAKRARGVDRAARHGEAHEVLRMRNRLRGGRED